MKVLLSYPSEHELGEGRHYQRVLQRLGHQVYVVNVATRWWSAPPGQFAKGYPPDITISELLANCGGADLFLWIEPFGLIPQGLEASPIPTAAVIGDVHRRLKPRLILARFFDHIFLYQRNYLGMFREHPQGAVQWLPYACDTEVFRDLHLSRDLDVAFIGTLSHPGRRRILETLARRYHLNELRFYRQEEIPEVYSRAKIVLNMPVGNDLNFRFFEALSCGAMLLTKRAANGQEELFQEGVHYVAYSNEHELFEKVNYYLHHERERERIARAGYEVVQERHTLAHRVQSLLEAIRQGPAFGAPIRKMGKRAAMHLYARIYERYGHVEALLRMAAAHRDRPLDRLYFLSMGLKGFLRRAVLSW